MPSLLAHGALGPFDEIIFLGIALVFLGMMGVSWLRSQALEDEALESDADVTEPQPNDVEHFELK